ncbi:MAG: 50S ribosomal protein L10 [Candidatus Aureabacteria bacterium]|nr:50S ribosomal protein L10 [Candidatus Auribacterota bacterium]
MRPDNKIIVKEYVNKLKKVDSVFITGFSGLKEEEFCSFRKELDKQQAEHRVIKNRLFKIITKEAGLTVEEQITPLLKGTSSFTIGGTDVISVAKTIVDFSKDHEKLEIKGAIFNGKVLTASEVKSLASLPSRHELLAKLVGTLAAPLTGIIGVLQAHLRNIVGVLYAIKEQKEKK